MIPVIALSSIDRGASTAIAALINALLGIGSIVTNIPSGVLATRIGERRSMLVAAAVAVAGLVLCLVNLGRGALSLAVFGLGVLLLGAASSVYTLARQSYLTSRYLLVCGPGRCQPWAACSGSGCSWVPSSGPARRNCGGCRAPTT